MTGDEYDYWPDYVILSRKNQTKLPKALCTLQVTRYIAIQHNRKKNKI